DIDGFWLVINDGPNPKSTDVNELAIMYGDLTDGDGMGILSTYAYNGQNNANSYLNPGIMLQSDWKNGALTYDSNSLSINLDVTNINAWLGGDPDYSGIAFDDQIGIWFHISTGSSFSYNDNDELTGYSYDSQGWYDLSKRKTSKVPEPAILSMFALGLIGVGLARRKMKS
ncbi:MAG: PEP-CTERM sorting domain-containing protein, partial [Pseudomonadota bacterium]